MSKATVLIQYEDFFVFVIEAHVVAAGIKLLEM